MSDEYDMQEDGLYVNFSNEEAASEAKDFEPLPSGKYLVTITEVNLKPCGPFSKNPGKPMYNIEFTVVGDKKGNQFVGRKIFSNVMLFSPALYSIAQLMKAISFKVAAGHTRLPNPEELMGEMLVVGGLLMGERKDKDDPSKVYAPRYEVKSYFPEAYWTKGGGAVTGKAGGDKASLLS